MQKRGLSNIIATVLLVLLAIGAIALIWSFIGGIIDDGTTNTGLQAECVTNTELEIRNCAIIDDTAAGNDVTANVTLLLNKGEQVVGATLIFEDEGDIRDPVELDSTEIPSPLETNRVTDKVLDSVDTTGEITVVVQARVGDADGNTRLCEATQTPVPCTIETV